MHDHLGTGRPGSERGPSPAASAHSAHVRRRHRASLRPVIASPDAAQLTAAVLSASNGSRVDLDEQYILTAFVVHRGHDDGTAPIVVELLDHGASNRSARWQAVAYDELSGAATHLGDGDSAEQALTNLDWRSLD